MSETKARYNVTITGEIDNLAQYTKTLAALIANLETGEQFKQLFDIEYYKHRAGFVRDKAICEEISAAERIKSKDGM